MWKHKIIENLIKRQHDTDDGYNTLADNIINIIPKCHEFYFGDTSNLQKILPLQPQTIDGLFSGNDLLMPYRYVLLDLAEFEDGKFSVLMEKLDNGWINLIVLCYDKREDLWGVTANVYKISPIPVEVGDNVKYAMGNLFKGMRPNELFIIGKYLLSSPTLANTPKDELGYAARAELELLVVVSQILSLFGANNITYTDHTGPARLNKKRIKNGKHPIYTYKTLNIKLGKRDMKRLNTDESSIPLNEMMPKHWRRATYRHYGPKYGKGLLFGKYEGKFLSPAVYINKDKDVGRIVEKDYKATI